MRKKPLGFLTIPGLVTSLLVVLVVIATGLLWGGALFSPGPLNAQSGALLGGVAAHAQLGGRCSACHAYFWQPASMAERCMLCHTDVSVQLTDPSTLHGDQLKKKPGTPCRACHPDHRGANASLVDLSMADLSHTGFGFVLTAHPQQSDGSPFLCSTCHVNGYSSFDQAVCVTCHQQLKADFMPVHIQTYGQNCLACHDGIDTYGHNFDHSKVAFPLTGKHASLDCITCHTAARSLTDLKATSPDCSSCHAKDDAHQGQLGTDCGACHSTAGWIPASFDHAKSKFPLTGAHASVDCAKCHLNGAFTVLDTACFSCHAKNDAHKGQFGTDCGQCHSTTAWLPATFDHSKSGFPLTGAHTGLACAKCHANGVFSGLSTLCTACHAEPAFHAGLFAGLSCDQCHNTSAWSPASFNLSHPGGCGERGCIGHEGATCRDCHTVNLSTATCLKCHDSNNPGDGGGGAGGGG